MLFFGDSYGLEDLCDLVEAFLPGDLGEPGIHLGPFVIFPGGRFLQVGDGIADYPCRKRRCYFSLTAFQELEKPFRVLPFLVGCLLKDLGYLAVTLFSGFAGKIGVPVPCLGLSGKSGEDIFFSFRTFICFNFTYEKRLALNKVFCYNDEKKPGAKYRQPVPFIDAIPAFS